MGSSTFSNADIQSLGNEALGRVTNLLGTAAAPTAADYNAQQQQIQSALNTALAQVNNNLSYGLNYSQTYNQSALDSMNAKYDKSQQDIAQAKAAQAGAMRLYTDQLGITQPATAVSPTNYQAGNTNVP